MLGCDSFTATTFQASFLQKVYSKLINIGGSSAKSSRVPSNVDTVREKSYDHLLALSNVQNLTCEIMVEAHITQTTSCIYPNPDWTSVHVTNPRLAS